MIEGILCLCPYALGQRRCCQEVFKLRPSAAACIHSFTGHIAVFLSGLLCFDSQTCLQLMSWGLTGLTSPSAELRSEGNIQHSCAYSEGRGQERRAAMLSGTGASLASEVLHTACLHL